MRDQTNMLIFAGHKKMIIMVFTKRLTNLQIELIKLFEYELDDSQLLEIKDILARYFAAEATKEMDNLWQEKGWTNDTKEGMDRNTHENTLQ